MMQFQRQCLCVCYLPLKPKPLLCFARANHLLIRTEMHMHQITLLNDQDRSASTSPQQHHASVDPEMSTLNDRSSRMALH